MSKIDIDLNDLLKDIEKLKNRVFKPQIVGVVEDAADPTSNLLVRVRVLQANSTDKKSFTN